MGKGNKKSSKKGKRKIPKNKDIEEVVERDTEKEKAKQIIKAIDEKRREFKRELNSSKNTCTISDKNSIDDNNVVNSTIDKKAENFSKRKDRMAREEEAQAKILKLINNELKPEDKYVFELLEKAKLEQKENSER